MSEVKFTPGPWSIYADVIRGDDKPNGCVSVACVLDVAYPYGRRAGEQAQANAHLIAAAPRMYDALLSASRVFRMYEEHHALKGAMDKAEANGSIADDIEKLLAEARGDK